MMASGEMESSTPISVAERPMEVKYELKNGVYAPAHIQ